MVDENKTAALRDMNRLFLDALRHREQDVLKFVALIGPALGGFIWMVCRYTFIGDGAFAIGTIGALLLLFVGSWYCQALGYNYRSITLQLVAIDRELPVRSVVLRGWPYRVGHVLARTKLQYYLPAFLRKKRRDWHNLFFIVPPELIAVFWHGFTGGILYITISSAFGVPLSWSVKIIVLFLGACSFGLAIGIIPCHYAKKLSGLCWKEIKMRKHDTQRRKENGKRNFSE